MKQRRLPLFGLACALTGSTALAQDSLEYKTSVTPRFSQPPPTTHALGLDELSPGLTLYQPMFDRTALLIDEYGTVVHSWPGTVHPGLSNYILPNGNFLKTGVIGGGPGGGGAGRVGEYTWDNQMIWEFDYISDDYLGHHDVEYLPNGNVLMIAWDYRTPAEAIANGRDPAMFSPETDRFSPDKIIEIQPDGMGSATIVWEWFAWDHLIQDFDNTKPNFGVVADHPELINLNFPPFPNNEDDWIHFNGMDYNAELDQIAVSSVTWSEIWIIDHSTTTAEAAGHTGGDSGKGGDILYRWGNPEAYGRGDADDKKLFGQHDIQWIEEGRPGEGNFICHNNGRDRPEGMFSTVEEWVSPADGAGNYPALGPGEPHGPAAAVWTYMAATPTDYFSNIISGAERLENGNTLITNGVGGIIFEVNNSMETLWEYTNTIPDMGNKWIFRARRFDVCELNGLEEDCPAIGTLYCDPAVPNSTGSGGHMTVRGSDVVADDALELIATHLPPASNIGYFVMGTGMTVYMPPGSAGPICVGPGIKRYLPPPLNTLGGRFARHVGTTGPISMNITPASTWNFQAWHRDAAAGTSNFTDAVSITFQ